MINRQSNALHAQKKGQWIVWSMLLCASSIWAQQDTVSRSVTVERDFQPIIQSAGKMNVSPERLTIQEPKVEIVYSDYSATDSAAFYAKPMRFPSKPFPTVEPSNGLLEVAAGYANTHVDFSYRVPVSGKASKGVKLDLFAKHDALWGLRTWEESALGMQFAKQFSDLSIFLDVMGGNTFFTRYGRYFDPEKNELSITRFKDLGGEDKQNIWTVNANVGVQSNKNADIIYSVQAGYQAYVMPNLVSEHQIRTQGTVEWNGDEHRAGADLCIRNAFYSVDERLWKEKSEFKLPHRSNPRHGIRITPFYKYVGDRLRVRAGVNLDLNIGKGQMNSNNKEISFAPSPDVLVEYRIIPSWLAVYAGAEGKFSFGTLDEYMDKCPYRNVANGVSTSHVASYTPVDAFVGFKIRAADNLLLDVYAHYAYLKNQSIMYADSSSLAKYWEDRNEFLDHDYCDFQQWKVGLELTYHYQDIIKLLFNGNYYHWSAEYIDNPLETAVDDKTVYDRPSWDLHLRIDAHIDSHWSLYSDNIFAGAVTRKTYWGSNKGKATIDLRLGARYDFNKDLGLYLQLNNYLNRHNDLFYGYQSPGIQVQVGASWAF